MVELVLVENESAATGASRKLEPRYKGPFIVTAILDKDRYVIEELPVFSRTQRHYRSIYASDKMKPWCTLPEIEDDEHSEEDEDSNRGRLNERMADYVAKNMSMWKEMLSGSEYGQKCCVRAKIDMSSPNGCMRDPTIYRYKNEPHPRTGTKYKVYPTYDFACPIVDAIENISHTLRTTEYHDRDDQFYWFIDALKLRKPYIWEYSRLNMTNTVLSKRKLTWFVDSGLVDGWDDPRFPTVRGIVRRGMTVEGLKEFIVAQGSSKSVVFMNWDKIWAFNKKVIDPIAPRYIALDYNNRVIVNIAGAKKEKIEVPVHPKNESLGKKMVSLGPIIYIDYVDAEALKECENATFINWGNLMIKKINRDPTGKITTIDTSLNLDNKDFKKTLKLTWLAAEDKTEDYPPTYCVYFDNIISKPVLGKDEDFKQYIGHKTRYEQQLLGDPELRNCKKGDIIQLQRRGFFKVDNAYAPPSCYSNVHSPVILFSIPDGHTKDIPSSGLKINTATNQNTKKTPTSNDKGWKPGETPVAPSKISANTIQELLKKISAQSDKVRQLKSNKADIATIDPEVKLLLALKEDYESLTGQEWQPGYAGSKNTVKIATIDLTDTKVEDILDNIKIQGDKIRKLKTEKASKSVIDTEVQRLSEIKAGYKTLTGKDWTPDANHVSKSAVVKQEEKMSSTPITEKNLLTKEINEQGEKVRTSKANKISKEEIDMQVAKLLALKAKYKEVTGEDFPVATRGGGSSSKKSSHEIKEFAKPTKPMKNLSEVTGAVKKQTRLGLEATKEEHLPDWYSQVITKGELIEYYDVSGCYILRHWSFAIWKVIRNWFDSEITKMGVKECYFPIFVSKAALEKEKNHIADFAPEVAWVTKSGDSDLAEPIAVRPTSETVMYPAYAKWIQSYRDLPIRLNQWNNVVRWEFKHPQPFLRTREFLWQEGHTAFANKIEADKEVLQILDLYAQIYIDLLAIPVVKGRKTAKEKFAGADYTTTVEAFISASGRAIQGATSHHLGQNFSKMFEIAYEDPETQQKQYAYQNSWGMTTRTIGVMIMVHADNQGLVLPPNVAAIQAIIVPCGITVNTNDADRVGLLNACIALEKQLCSEGIRCEGDYRDNYSPGWKFNHWELKGVPLRIELGPKDLLGKQVVAVRRDTGEKLVLPIENLETNITQLLKTIHDSMLAKAQRDLASHTKVTRRWADFCKFLDLKNILLSPFCGEISCEDKIKEDSARDDDAEPGAPAMGAKSLCIPFDQPESIAKNDICIHPACKNKPRYFTLFGRSY